MRGKCLVEGVVYKCEGKPIGGTANKWEYIGETGGNIKKFKSSLIIQDKS